MNILTFDIEEWFHVLDVPATKSEKAWQQYESRIHLNMERIFSLLSQHQQKATFFCLGWVSRRYPELVKSIIERNCEVGSHSNLHELVYEQSPSDFKKDVETSIKALEDLTGRKVKYFRAPGFSIMEKNKWAFEILADLGIEIDCSIFPTTRAHGGFPRINAAEPFVLEYQGVRLKELPINTTNLLGQRIVFSGGGYFRFWPYYLIKRWSLHSSYIMAYFHPRDFDSEQPVIRQLSLKRRFKSYVSLKSSFNKLSWWLEDFEFCDIRTADRLLRWEQAEVIKL
jgi:polysaccharide deacetylase family protein (PEP-CTERM system associated)